MSFSLFVPKSFASKETRKCLIPQSKLSEANVLIRQKLLDTALPAKYDVRSRFVIFFTKFG